VVRVRGSQITRVLPNGRARSVEEPQPFAVVCEGVEGRLHIRKRTILLTDIFAAVRSAGDRFLFGEC
jgi:hypothetical protein